MGPTLRTPALRTPALRIGVDLGGTKIEAIAFDPAGRMLMRHRVPTPAGDATARIAAIRDLVGLVEAQLGARGTVGVGTPGALSPVSGLIRNANSTCFNGQPLDRLLAEALGREVRIANDANCFALSEATDGAGAGVPVVFGVILGTGVGGGLVIDGKILTGRHAIAGEWGHNPLPWPEPGERPGPACYCGRTGCTETFLSGPGFAADHAAVTGEALLTAEIVARAEAGDGPARASLERYIDRLARGLAAVINLVDPDVIVLGGGLSNLTMLYEAVPARWGRYVFSDTVATRLVPPHHGDSSGVRGAAWLWPLPDRDSP
ncbi:ROK family protein [Aliidongia dinghuensis]|nr:ROK family protein [Aliidongia dinghuensis]